MGEEERKGRKMKMKMKMLTEESYIFKVGGLIDSRISSMGVCQQCLIGQPRKTSYHVPHHYHPPLSNNCSHDHSQESPTSYPIRVTTTAAIPIAAVKLRINHTLINPIPFHPLSDAFPLPSNVSRTVDHIVRPGTGENSRIFKAPSWPRRASRACSFPANS